MLTANEMAHRRARRVRHKITRKGRGRPRLSVFRSGRHIYAQVIDDGRGFTLAAASTVDKELKGKLAKSSDLTAAAEVGKLIAARAGAAGIKQVVLDRGCYRYHGRVKALAEAAREAGLDF